MKKSLLTACGLTVLSSTSISAAIKEGFNVSVIPGVVYNHTAYNTEIRQTYSISNSKKRSGFNLDGALGYTWSLKDIYFIGARLLGGYNFSEVVLGRSLVYGFSSKFKPRWNYGVGMMVGGCLSQSLNGYLGLNLLRNESRVRIDYDTGEHLEDGKVIYSLMPLAGLTAEVSDDFSWMGELGYKIGFKTKGLERIYRVETGRSLRKYIKNPRVLMARMGMTYHF